MTSPKTVNIVVGGLVLIVLAMLALVGIISVDDSPASVPEGLWTLLGGAVGALAAMLSRTSSNDAPVAPPAPPAVGPTAADYTTP